MEKISVKIDYKELLVNFWKTNHENPRGIFYIHHGMAEHIDRYKPFAVKLNSFGFHVVGHNHLGHGDNKENGEGIFSPSKGCLKFVRKLAWLMSTSIIFIQNSHLIYLDIVWELL